MKKTVKKLTLHRETLRELAERALDTAHGGFTNLTHCCSEKCDHATNEYYLCE